MRDLTVAFKQINTELLWSANNQEYSMGGNQNVSQGMSMHGCSAWSLQREGAGPWDCRMRRVAGWVFRRVWGVGTGGFYPEKTPTGKGEVCFLQPRALHGTAKGCAPA